MKIEEYKNNDEITLWKGKPNKSVYIREHIFSPLLFFAILWLAADAFFIFIYLSNREFNFEALFIVPFFLIHLMPVWLYIGRVIFAYAKWNKTEYLVTDKAIYCTNGVFTTNCQRKTFQEVTNISLHQGIIDKRHDVGDIFIITGFKTDSNGKYVNVGINIVDIEDYIKVYKLISKTGNDIFSDTMYPNDLRPKENHGYKTNYNPEE